MASVDEKITTYDTTFGKIVTLKTELDQPVANLDKLGPEMNNPAASGRGI